MWVFGYGSLMWDGWERRFQGVKHERAKLKGYHRDFNKSSTVNWGTRERPCPTLGLERVEGTECVGCAFEFDDTQRDSILDYLRGREGQSFELKELEVELKNGAIVSAVTPVNRRNNTYIEDLSIEARAKQVQQASGKYGRCFDYVQNIHRHLKDLGIDDEYVERMRRLQEKSHRRRTPRLTRACTRPRMAVLSSLGLAVITSRRGG